MGLVLPQRMGANAIDMVGGVMSRDRVAEDNTWFGRYEELLEVCGGPGMRG
jgi:hypothetical protein